MSGEIWRISFVPTALARHWLGVHGWWVLLAAIGYWNMDIARLGPMDEEAVGVWRRRWAGWRAIPIEEISVVDRLTDPPRPGVQPRLTAEQVCQIVALACEQPSGSGRPISQ